MDVTIEIARWKVPSAEPKGILVRIICELWLKKSLWYELIRRKLYLCFGVIFNSSPVGDVSISKDTLQDLKTNQMFGNTTVPFGIVYPLYTSSFTEHLARPRGRTGCQRKASLTIQSIYGSEGRSSSVTECESSAISE